VRKTATCFLAASILCALPGFAGEIMLDWEPSQSATGYKVYRGESPGQYTWSIDVNGATTTAMDGLPDCTLSYFATTAYNAVGESGYSNEVASWARPVVAAVNPPSVGQGTQATLSIIGTNFRAGSIVTFSGSGIVLQSLEIISCNEIRAGISVNGNAPSGSIDVTVVHPNGVAGAGIGLFATGGPPVAPESLTAF
jgi:hypothetical protein